MFGKASLLNLPSTFANLAEELALAFNRHAETQTLVSTHEPLIKSQLMHSVVINHLSSLTVGLCS